MEVRTEGRPPVQGPEHRKEIYSRSLDRTLPVHDARAEFASMPRRSRSDREALSAFLESKREMIRSHARLTASEKRRALAEIDSIESGAGDGAPEAESDTGGVDGGDDDPPLPGGVGFGVFYDAAYKIGFDSGTVAEFSILCPDRPGGNVDTWLYLTATNRSSLGVEAYVAYYGQDEPSFVVFDWSRKDSWQVNRPFSALGAYLHDLPLNGGMHQALRVLNFTYQSGETSWINEVLLQNVSTRALDLVYAHEYQSTGVDQRSGWTGSWGPIVETFQNLYHGTNQLGFATFSVASRQGEDWEPWEPLSPAETYVRQDGVGFQMLYLDPNHTFVAGS